jgi:hypothetical protein
MTRMTARDRFMALLDFQSLDRIPQMDFGYWEETVDAWHEQGLPTEIITAQQVEDYFGLDRGFEYTVFHSYHTPGTARGLFPPFQRTVLEDEGDKVIVRDEEGVILRETKRMKSIPHFIRFPVESREDYEALRWRLDGSEPARYPDNWDQQVQRMLASERPKGMWLNGFFGWSRKLMGLENLCLAYYDQPDLVELINRDHVQFIKDLSRRAFEDLPIEYVCFWEDMAFKNGPLVSPGIFRRFLTPFYHQIIDLLRVRGAKKILVDCDGDVRDLIALFIEAGVDGLFPCERAAGSDPVELRQRYPRFALLGGVDKKALIAGPEAIDRELAHLEPVMAEGGYIPSVDHRVPPDVQLAHYRYLCEERREILMKI